MHFKPAFSASILALSTVVALPAWAQSDPSAPITGALAADDATEADGRHYDDHAIDLTAGTRYRINAGSEAFDMLIRLYGPAGGPALAEDDDGGDALNSRITFTPSESGSYRLRVTTYDSTGLGDYTASVEALAPLPEPTTTPTGTETMNFTVFEGALADGDAEDEAKFDDYLVTLTGGEAAWIQATSDAFDAVVKVYPVGQRDGEPAGMDDDSGGGLNALLIFTPETTGEYIVRVTSYEGGSMGAYKLRIGH